MRITVSRSESPLIAWTTNARRIVSEVKSPLRPCSFSPSPSESSLRSSWTMSRISGFSSRIRLISLYFSRYSRTILGRWSLFHSNVNTASFFSTHPCPPWGLGCELPQRIRMRPFYAIPSRGKRPQDFPQQLPHEVVGAVLMFSHQPLLRSTEAAELPHRLFSEA